MVRSGLTNQAGIALPWLVGLRWLALVCQAVLLVVVAVYINIPVPLPLVMGIFAFGSLSNLYLHRLKKKQVLVSDEIITAILILDTGLLTMLLFLTGGAMNPFTFLYLVHLVLGAILLPVRWSWTLLVTTIVCYGSLFYPGVAAVGDLGGHPPACQVMGEISGPMLLHLKGMWVAYAITACFVVFFVGKIQKALSESRKTREALEEERARGELLATMTILAAGAAHELSTPLSTIAVASGEMINTIGGSSDKDDPEDENLSDLLDDAQLIRTQVESCKEILFQMAHDTGLGEGVEEDPFGTEDAVEQILDSLQPEERGAVQVNNDIPEVQLALSLRTFCYSVAGLLRNALRAGTENDQVELTLRLEDSFLLVEVKDQGVGMDQDTLRKSVEPFFTTRDNGLGLGLFLARTLADRHGGFLDIDSSPGKGTTVSLRMDYLHIQGGQS